MLHILWHNITQINSRLWKFCKRGIALLLPMFFIGMAVFDVMTMASHHYPENMAVNILKIAAVFFYLTCLWCILRPWNKWNIGTLVVASGIIVGMFVFNADIQNIYQHARCLEVSTVACPDGVVLNGG